MGKIAAAVTPRTRAIMLNTRTIPPGGVYPEAVLRALDGIAGAHWATISVISRRAYDALVYRWPATVQGGIAGQKYGDLQFLVEVAGLAGERIGYLALSPSLADREQLRAVLHFQ